MVRNSTRNDRGRKRWCGRLTKEETGKILAVINAYYPYFFKDMNSDGKRAVIDLWSRQFVDYDYAMVNTALDAYISVDEKGYAPNVGTLKSLIIKMTQPEEMTEIEAWGYVAKALRNSSYSSVEEFEKLPEQIKKIVGSPTQLKEWSMGNLETVQSVIASNFQRSYKAKVKSYKEHMALPSSIRNVIEKLADSKDLNLLGGKVDE